MARPGQFQAIFDLDIGEDIIVQPKHGETIENALRRFKVRTSKYRKQGRSYVVEADGENIRITRVHFDTQKRLWRWKKMKAGETLVLNERPSSNDVRSAKQTAYYLSYTAKFRGIWEVSLDIEGRLVTTCYVDNDGNIFSRSEQERVARQETEDERLDREARNWASTARFIESEATSCSNKQLKLELRYKAEAFWRKSEELRQEAAKLRGDIDWDNVPPIPLG